MKNMGFTPHMNLYNTWRSSKTRRISSCEGFTIIELLVVVSIISVVAAVGLALLSNTRVKSRDSRRVEDVRQVQNALNLYAADHDNLFPSAGTGNPSSWSLLDRSASDVLTQTLIPDHMPIVPNDPLHDGVNYYYRYRSYGGGAAETDTANDYDIEFCLETNAIPNYSLGCGNVVSP